MSALIHVKAAYPQVSVVVGPLFVAADEGFFRKHGLDVSLTQVGGTQEIPALMSQELQFGGPGSAEAVNADLGGSSVVMVAAQTNVSVQSLYVAQSIKSVNDLAGKTIAVTSPGSATDLTAKVFLQHYGISGKVKVVPAGTIAGVLAAMEKGTVVGGMLAPATTVRAGNAGYVELINGARLGVPLVQAGIIVTRDYLKMHRDVVTDFLGAYQDAWTFIGNPKNRAVVVSVLRKWTKSNEAAIQASYQYMLPVWQAQKVPAVNPKGLESVLSATSNPKAKGADPKQFIDNSIIESIPKSS